MVKECLYCSRQFEAKKLGRPQKFCQPSCRGLHWKKRNPIKKRAHQAIHRIHRKKKPLQTCEQCGINGRVQAHHPDYKKPKEVKHLCISCHSALHPKRKRMAV